MFKAYLKNLLLALAFVIGILMPEAARAAWLIQYSEILQSQLREVIFPGLRIFLSGERGFSRFRLR